MQLLPVTTFTDSSHLFNNSRVYREDAQVIKKKAIYLYLIFDLFHFDICVFIGLL